MLKKLNIDKLYEKIYKLCLKENKIELDNLIRSDEIDINLLKNDEILMSLLIGDGQSKAVIFLIKNYGCDLKKIIYQAISANQIELILDLMQDDHFDFGEIFEEFTNIVIRLENENPKKSKQINEILAKKLTNLILINKMMDYLSNNKDRLDKLLIKNEKLINIEQKLHLSTNEAELWLNEHKDLDNTQLKIQAHNLNLTMQHHAISQPELAKLWRKPDTHLWFLIGIEMVRNKTFPIELFIKISSYVFESQDKQASELFDEHIKSVPEILRKSAEVRAYKKYHETLGISGSVSLLFFKSTPKSLAAKAVLESELKEAENRYERRVNFM